MARVCAQYAAGAWGLTYKHQWLSFHRMIIQGDVFKEIQRIPDGTFDCIITSPPYWGMRAYFGKAQVKEELGREWDFNDYLDKLMIVMSECKRILKDTGTVWVNIGDPYCGSGKGHSGDGKSSSLEKHNNVPRNPNDPFAAKCRVGIPERFYVRCIDAGWIARNHIAWHKPNAVPNSAQDRFSINWESVFFFSKKGTYYFNLDPLRVKPKYGVTRPFNIRIRDNKKKVQQLKLSGEAKEDDMLRHTKNGELLSHKNMMLDRPNNTPHTMHVERKYDRRQWINRHSGGTRLDTGESMSHKRGKNPGAIFHINTKPYSGKHQATFPVALPERIIKCAVPEGGIVLDPFFGAGSTGVACEKQGRMLNGLVTVLGRSRSGSRLKKYLLFLLKKNTDSQLIWNLSWALFGMALGLCQQIWFRAIHPASMHRT